MHNDFTPYYVRVGDSWTLIDYSKQAEEWMKPLVRGEETDLVEIPANWYLDDLPPMMFIKKAPNSHGFVNPRDIEEMWMRPVRLGLPRDGLRRVHHDHPPGRLRAAQVLLMHERIIEHINEPRRRALVHVRRDRRRLPQALAAREVARSRIAQ